MGLLAEYTPVNDTVPMPLPAFFIAFQPIVHVETQRVVAYEALTRGRDGRAYPELVEGMDAATLHSFHRKTATEAMRRAVALGIKDMNASLCLNLEPDLHPEALDAEFLLQAACACGLDPAAILLELTENRRLDTAELHELLERNQAAGFSTGVDDFGAGYSGLTMLVDCKPEVLKLDRALVRGIDSSNRRQKIVAAFAEICTSLNMSLVAEGVETMAECAMLRKLGVTLMQGFLFSRPMVDGLPECVAWENDFEGGVARGGTGAIASWQNGIASVQEINFDYRSFAMAAATLPA